jgi:kinesin family protein 5
MSASESVKVCFRFRNATKSSSNAVKFLDDCQVSVMSEEMKERGERVRQYRFDRVWQGDSSQEDVYRTMGQPLLKNIFEGYNSTLFVYGQTGSGKTYTMFGPDGGQMNNADEGVVPRLMRELFQVIERQGAAKPDTKYTVNISIVDVYLEKVRDLQNTDVLKKRSDAGNLKVRYDARRGVSIAYPDDRRHLATESEATSYDQVLDLINKAIKLRAKTGAQAATKMNDTSSRSHLVVQVKLKEESPDGIKESKLLLCDLAGSEKARNTGARGKQLEQAKNINYGLSVLGAVLNALTDSKKAKRRANGKGTIPFTESNLTRILQDSLGGNCKTALLCTGRPDDMFYGETISTLRFGNNAKKIKNNVIKNETLTLAQYQKRHRAFEQQVSDLAAQIQVEQAVKQRAIGVASVLERELVERGVDIEDIRRKHKVMAVSELESQSMEASNKGGHSPSHCLFAPSGSVAGFSGQSFGAHSGSCSCGLATSVAKLRLQNQELEDELAASRAETRAHDNEVDYLQGQLSDYRMVAEEWKEKDAELARLKGESYKYAMEAQKLQEQVKSMRLEQESRSKSGYNIEAFRKELMELGTVALDDSTRVLKIINHGDSEQHLELVEHISNQTAENHRLQTALDETRAQIGAHDSLKEHMRGIIGQNERQILATWTLYLQEKNKFESEQQKLEETVERQGLQIADLKTQRDGSERRRAFGLEAYMSRLTSLTPKRKKARRRRNVASASEAKMSIVTSVAENPESMMSPCA